MMVIKKVWLLETSLASLKRCTTQTLVVKIGISTISLKFPSFRDGSTQSIIANIESLETKFCPLNRDTPCDTVVIQVQEINGLSNLNLGDIELEHVS